MGEACSDDKLAMPCCVKQQAYQPAGVMPPWLALSSLLYPPPRPHVRFSHTAIPLLIGHRILSDTAVQPS